MLKIYYENVKVFIVFFYPKKLKVTKFIVNKSPKSHFQKLY